MQLPTDIAEGVYFLVAVIDTADVVAEDDESDNVVTADGSIAVAAPFIDLSATVGASPLPAQMIAGDDATGSLPITVRNRGNIGVQANIQMHVLATPDGDPDNPANVLLATLDDQSINLAPGQTKDFLAAVSLPADMPEGTYSIMALIDTTDVVAESDEQNNDALTTSVVNVGSSVIDVTGQFGAVDLPPAVIAGTPVSATVPLTVISQSNIPIAAQIDITVLASPDADPANPDNVVLAQLDDRAINLVPDGTRALTVPIDLPTDMPAGQYRVIALLDAGDELAEDDETNNLVLSDSFIAIAAPFVDLIGTIGALALPPQVIAGDDFQGVMPVTVRNDGNVQVQANIQVQIVASPDGDPDNPAGVLLATLAGQSINLVPGATKSLSASFAMPADMAEGDYHIVAVIDAADVVVESDEANNAVATGATVHVGNSFVDLTAELGTIGLPPAVIAGDPVSVTVPVFVHNLSNIQIAAQIDIAIVASPDGDPANPGNIVLADLVNRPIDLAAGSVREMFAQVTLPPDMPEGQYQVLAIVDADDAVAEDVEDNNVIVTGTFIAVAAPFVDLVGTVSGATLPPDVIAGADFEATLPVIVQNAGNVPVQANIEIQVVASPDAGPAGASGIVLTTLTGQSINLQPGGFKDFNAPFTLPADMPANDYFIIAVIDATDVVVESDEVNNIAVVDAPLGVTSSFVDLVGTFGPVTLPPAVIAGADATGDVPIAITNASNIPVQAQIDIVLQASPDGDPANPANLTLAQLLGRTINLLPGQVRDFDIPVDLPASTPEGTYTLVATVDAADSVAEDDETNNVFHADGTIAVAVPFVDLAGTIGFLPIPPQVVAGDGEGGDIPIQVANRGNIAVQANIDIQTLLTPDGDPANPANIVLETLSGLSINLQPGGMKEFLAHVELPADIPEGDYFVMIIADASDGVAESDESNNVALTAEAFMVVTPFIDLTARFDAYISLPTSMVSGDLINVFLPLSLGNQGNVFADQSVDIAILATPDGDPAGPLAILLRTVTGEPLALAPGSERFLGIEVLIPADMPAGQFHFAAIVDATDVVVESNDLNNTAVTDATLTVDAALVDLSAAFGPLFLPTEILAGDPITFDLPLEVRNDGNTTLFETVRIDLFAADSATGAAGLLLDSFETQLILAPGGSQFLHMTASFPPDMPVGTYQFTAVVDAA